MDLESARKAEGLTQAQLAAVLGISKSLVSGLESGAQTAGAILALRIEKWSGGRVPAADLCPSLRGLVAEPALPPAPEARA